MVSQDERSNHYVQENGIGANLSKVIGELETHLSSIANHLLSSDSKDVDILHLKSVLNSFTPEEEHTKRVCTLLGIVKHEAKIRPLLNGQFLANFNLAIGRIGQIISAFKTCNTYILPNGEIEHYYTQSEMDYLDISNKDNCFHAERDYLLQIESEAEVIAQYSELVNQIKHAVPTVEIEIRKHLKFEIFEWIHRVQTGIARKEINNTDDLTRNNKINYALYGQILNLEDLVINEDRTFRCRIRVKSMLDETQPVIEFNQMTNAHSFSM